MKNILTLNAISPIINDIFETFKYYYFPLWYICKKFTIFCDKIKNAESRNSPRHTHHSRIASNYDLHEWQVGCRSRL